MKKLILSTSVALALGLAGCGGGESIDDINNETQVDIESALSASPHFSWRRLMGPYLVGRSHQVVSSV